MTPREIFSKILELSSPSGVRNYDSFSIYQMSALIDDDITYRVDCGDKGSFEISKRLTEDMYSTTLNRWVSVPSEHYVFCCLSSTHDGYPRIKPEQVKEIIGNK